MDLHFVADLVLRIVMGSICGALIGIERQWRARTAGVRTNALVALGSALFVIMGAYSFTAPDSLGIGSALTGADPTRVAAGVVSGIGFLGAGVIMKQGGSVSGLNTAATLWASAAVGALVGGGMMWVGIVGTFMVMFANMALRPVGRLLDRRTRHQRSENTEVEYDFEVRCNQVDEVRIRSLVFEAVQSPDLTVRSIAANDVPGDLVLITATLYSPERDDHRLEQAIDAVIKDPDVISVRWQAQDLTSAD